MGAIPKHNRYTKKLTRMKTANSIKKKSFKHHPASDFVHFFANLNICMSNTMQSLNTHLSSKKKKCLINIIYNLFKKLFFILTLNNIRFSDHLAISGMEFQISTPTCLIISPDLVVCLISLVNCSIPCRIIVII